MSRATGVYAVMVVVFVAGLWVVLAIGATLTPPADLRGRWSAVGPAKAGGWPAVTIDQSGRYFELAFDGGPHVSGAVVGGSPDRAFSLARQPWTVAVGPPDAAGTRTFTVAGPTSGTFVGRRERKEVGSRKLGVGS